MAQAIRHKTDTMTFGKHKGKTVRWIIEHDPSYIIWLHENKVCEIPEDFVDEAIDNDSLDDYPVGPNYSSYYDD